MTHPQVGELIPFVAEITPAIVEMAKGTASATAVGGMSTKIEAARIATKSGCAVFIGSGENSPDLARILSNQAEGTFFPPSGLDLNHVRSGWLFSRKQKELYILMREQPLLYLKMAEVFLRPALARSMGISSNQMLFLWWM